MLAKNISKEELIKEIQPTVCSENGLKEQYMLETNYDIGRFKGKYLQTTEKYKENNCT